MSRRLGLDVWDVAIHVVVTIALAVAMGEVVGGSDAGWAIPGVIGISGVVFGIRRRLALRRAPPEITTGEVQMARLDEIEERLFDLDQSQGRLAELEDRVDFAERLLAQRGDLDRLPGVREGAGE